MNNRRQRVAALVSAFALLAAIGADMASAQDGTGEPPEMAAPSAEPSAEASAEPIEGDEFYCQERRLGSYFYCERPKAAEKAALAPSTLTPAAASQRLKEIGQRLDDLRALAILQPTTDNVTAYIRYQREQLDRSSTFADVWGRATWQHPDLDYTLQRPVNTLGKRLWSDQRRMERASTMASLSQRYGVFYFYSSSCGACEVFSPILRSLSDQYGMTVLPVSMDGGPNAAFPNYVVNTNQYQQMGLTDGTVPALVLFDTQTKQPIPIGYGVMSADEVMQRIYYLTNIKPGSDY